MSEPIVRPDSKAFPVDFYDRIAARYVELAKHTKKVGVQIAAESGAPLTTVHRWIREARRRGLLTRQWTEFTAERTCPTCGRGRTP